VPPSPSSIGKGRDGMSIVALWTQGKEDRRKEFERRLKRWARREGKEMVESEILNQNDQGEDLRWATSSVSHLLRHVPTAELPPLDYAVPAIAHTSTPSPKKPRSDSLASSSPTTPRSSSTVENSLPVVSPKDFVKALLDGRPVKAKSGTTEDRAKARRERVCLMSISSCLSILPTDRPICIADIDRGEAKSRTAYSLSSFPVRISIRRFFTVETESQAQ
jgi:hypothetical protein